MDNRKYRRLVLPGRFQPPHYGHLHTIKQALDLADEVIIVIGSAQDSFSLKNPLTAGERFYLLDKLLKAHLGEGYCKRVKIVPVADIAMNKVWVQYLRMLLPPFDGVISGNQLVLMLFEDMGLVAIKPELINRDVCSGTKIREKIMRGESWENCVPEEIREDLRRMGFNERIRRLLIDG
jgi:nicotinamide-nucleotide adenylyltransferase